MEVYTSAVIAGILRSISAAGLVLLVLLPSGCGPQFNFDGTWKGNRNLPIKNGENPGVVRTLGQVTLTIEGSRFKLAEMGIPMDGSFTVRDGKGFLKIESRAGTPIDKEPAEIQKQMKEIELTPRKDGKLDYFDPGGFFDSPVTLTREPAKP
jgi:hypothetical protein